MIAIFETYNRTHNVLELVHILPNVSFTTSDMGHDYYCNKSGKYELTDELPNDVRLEKT